MIVVNVTLIQKNYKTNSFIRLNKKRIAEFERRKMLLIYSIDNLFISYASLQVFFKFLSMKRIHNRNKIISIVTALSISTKYKKRKDRTNSLSYWVRLRQTSS